jgi:hypothetical protein
MQFTDKRKEYMHELRREELSTMFENRRRKILKGISPSKGQNGNNEYGSMGSENKQGILEESLLQEDVSIVELMQSLSFFKRCKDELKRVDSREFLSILAKIRERMSAYGDNVPVDDFIGSGLYQIISMILDPHFVKSNPEHAREATWIMCNACMGTKIQLDIFINLGYVEVLQKLLSKGVGDVQTLDHIIWGVCNMIGKSFEIRDYILDHPILSCFLELMRRKSMNIELETRYAWLCCNLLNGPEYPPLNKINAFAEQACSILLAFDGESLHTECISAISCYLTPNDHKEERISNILGSKVFRKIRTLFIQEKQSPLNIKALLNIIGMLLLGTSDQVDMILDTELISGLIQLTKSMYQKFAAEALWCLGVCMASSQRHNSMVSTQELFSKISEILIDIGNVDVKVQAVKLLEHFVVHSNTYHAREVFRNNNEVGL